MVILNHDLEFVTAKKFERFKPPRNSNRRSSSDIYSLGYFIADNENSSGTNNNYVFGQIANNLDVKIIDTVFTNLNFNYLPRGQYEAFGRLYCFGKTNDEIITINDEKINNEFDGWTTVFISIDSTGKTKYLDQIANFSDPILSFQNDFLWLKVMSGSQEFSFLNRTVNAEFWLENKIIQKVFWYIAINSNNQVIKTIQGPITSLGFPNNTPSFFKNSIHDIYSDKSYYNLHGIDFDLEQTNQTSGNGIFKNSIIYSVSPQLRPKLSFRYIDCNSIEINYNKTDADHFLIIHSSDTNFVLPKDNENYNYSPDFFLAPEIGEDKVIYQGADSSIVVKNLPSSKSHYFMIVPGNGISGATSYNLDSIDSIEVFIPKISNAQLDITPNSDTSSCQSDTLFANASSTYPIRWMDGKTENRRFVPETGDYYFTVKDSQGCVLSSDTVTITKHPTPEINRIEASQKPPFCLGDSVWFAANSFVLGAHPDSVKYASKAMKTGWYTVKLTNRFECQSTDSIYAKFGQKPTFKFLQDSVLSFDNKLRAKYSTNADSLLWVYGLDSANGYTNYVVTDSQYLFINAIDQSGCNIWDSILTMYKEPISEAFPNAFSPNGDGVNDEWYFLHPDTLGTLIIYDRWGGIVHHGPNRWDGKKNGEILPAGAYRYTFRFIENGEEKVRRGLIALIK